MKPFCFKKFCVSQNQKVFRVGTDAVLLGALASVVNIQSVLEVGAGTGIVSLMLAQRNPNANILAIDINKDSAELAHQNFKNSCFEKQLTAIHQNFKKFQEDHIKFDLIVSNPPYFEANASTKDVLARQNIELGFADFIEKSAKLISQKGILSVIIPFESGNEFIEICNKYGFHLVRKVNVKGIENAKIKRLILEFSLIPKDFREEDFVIEKGPRKYSDQYLELTKDFHVFGKN